MAQSTTNSNSDIKARMSGRRKTAVATVSFQPGKGKITVNGRPMEDYFCTESQRLTALKPLLVTETRKKYDIAVRAQGGGLSGQAGAMSLALSRYLVQLENELKPTLKKSHLLTRDSRMKERKKSGQPGARKRFQFSKR